MQKFKYVEGRGTKEGFVFKVGGRGNAKRCFIRVVEKLKGELVFWVGGGECKISSWWGGSVNRGFVFWVGGGKM